MLGDSKPRCDPGIAGGSERFLASRSISVASDLNCVSVTVSERVLGRGLYDPVAKRQLGVAGHLPIRHNVAVIPFL